MLAFLSRFSILACFIFFCGNIIGQTLPVMTYNIRYATERDGENSWEKRKEAMVQLLEDYHPMIIGTQEGLHHQLEYLTKELGPYKYIGVARDDGKQKGEFSAILYDTTRLEVSRENTFWLMEPGDKDSIGWDAAYKRICTYGLFRDKLSGSSFWVFNAHFDHVGLEARKQSAQQIKNVLSERCDSESRVIIMGDFNSEPGSEPVQIIERWYADGLKLAREKQKEPLGTFTGWDKDAKLDRRIDYIFVHNFGVEKYLHLSERRGDGYFISDHLPVMAWLRLTQ
ncbi:MAG TPA: endonuclease/exonuclease/phosphatase [Cryomorphaceae bacterium]|nr:endonuclease/exonuclease/phosphatase [Owenweeksia sp.]HBF18704.1 endonuclease/exonuclease/phosphatase [Cryomorphaceae bacterium]HCQ16345.1 endonuclease/exonuclease/phosphatase [Cryomorphaceae bacterium]|tara:strand:- start:2497 stop:3345 length:849 start_codon:yes stop_codon:yes gene_type:complete